MNYVPYHPKGELEDCIETIFYVESYNPEHRIERLIPDGYSSLVMELDDQERYVYDNDTSEVLQTCQVSWVSGIFDEFISISSLNQTELMAVRFKPGGLFPFIDSDVHYMKNRIIPSIDLFGSEINTLRKDIIKVNDPLKKISLFEQWLKKVKNNMNKDHNPKIMAAMKMIINDPSAQQIKTLASKSGYSNKHFIQLFKKEIGVTPKIFQRILKFNQIIPKIQNKEKLSWTSISHECGYFDQAHFIHDFKKFSGFNPTSFLDESFDRLNFFPME
jgi:AraC-like DNA-binding protein